VKLNMDVYWVTVGGESPAEFIDRYSDRVGYYHFKDGPYAAAGSVTPGPYEFTELGKGTVDLASALQAALKYDPTWIVYEQDRSELEPKVACQISRQYLQSIGI
jgi:sugar phosphate isomerase/epimerase